MYFCKTQSCQFTGYWADGNFARGVVSSAPSPARSQHTVPPSHSQEYDLIKAHGCYRALAPWASAGLVVRALLPLPDSPQRKSRGGRTPCSPC